MFVIGTVERDTGIGRDTLADTLPEASLSPQDIDPAHAKLIDLASSGDIPALTAALEQALARDRLRSFVLDTFAPLTKAVGELWAGGQLQIFEEHIQCTNQVFYPSYQSGNDFRVVV